MLSIRDRNNSVLYSLVGASAIVGTSLLGSYFIQKYTKNKDQNKIKDVEKPKKSKTVKVNSDLVIMFSLYNMRKLANLFQAMDYPKIGGCLYITDVVFGLGFYGYKLVKNNNEMIKNSKATKLQKFYWFNCFHYGFNIFYRLTDVFITGHAYARVNYDSQMIEHPQHDAVRVYEADSNEIKKSQNQH
jgi:hypothetical protein